MTQTSHEHAHEDLALDIHHVAFQYNAEPVLKDVNLTLKRGGVAIIQGENGSGKSTLLRLILGELKPQQGMINLLGYPVKQHAKAYPQVGYLPQVQNMAQVTFPVTCLELATLDLYRKLGPIKLLNRRAKAQAKAQLEALHLQDYVYTPFKELSGGLKQRVMIARAMMRNPELLILDEPTAGVDEESKRGFLKVLAELSAQGLTLVIVTHEMSLLLESFPDAQTYSMKEGVLHAGL